MFVHNDGGHMLLHMSKSVRSLSRNSNGGITKYDRMRSHISNGGITKYDRETNNEYDADMASAGREEQERRQMWKQAPANNDDEIGG